MKTVRHATMPIEQLEPAEYNPRKISDEALEGLGNSLDRFGLVQPIVWNERTRRIVGGHQRVKALKQRGVQACDVMVVDLDELEEKALNIALNNPHIEGDFTKTSLQELLSDIRSQDMALFRDLNLDRLLEEDKPMGGGDEVPGLPENPMTQPGDIWLLGESRLACGSSADVDLVRRLVGDTECQCMWTDPPYGIDYGGKGGAKEYTGRVNPSKTRTGTIANDTMENVIDVIPKAFAAADEYALPPGASIYIAFSCSPERLALITQMVKDIGWTSKQWLIWVKDRLAISRWCYQPQYEPILYACKPGAGRHGRFGGAGWYGDDKQSDIVNLPRPKVSKEHPTMKPLELITGHLMNSTRIGDFVYEPFAGSGSTVIAATSLDRRCLAVELEPAYCDVVVARWETLTGKKAARQEVA